MSATRGVALLVAMALVVGSTGACTAKKDPNKPNFTISGPGPEILVGGLLVFGGVSLAAKVGSEEDQFNTQQTLVAIGVGIAILGVVVVGHGIYRLTKSDPPPQQPPGPPVTPTQ